MDHVSFTDSSGVRWSVSEDGADESRAHGSADAAPGTAWLRFESEYEVRRLWHYPDDWRGLNPLQLESLLERASTVIARFRPVGHTKPLLDTDRPSITRRASQLDSQPSRAHPGPDRPRHRNEPRSDDPDAS
jgi:hypothetical protein